MIVKDIKTMIHPNYGLISEDFRGNRYDANSDSTYLLRMMLFRGGSEADRRYYLSDGEKAKEYRRLAYELDEMADDIEHCVNETGQIKPEYVAMIFEALVLARHLLLSDQLETGIQYETIMRSLSYPQKYSWPENMAA
ncbi:hypothetical protein ES708_09990 [subsurface metagenome]